MDLDAVRRRVAKLRTKTEANGAGPGEAANAAAKADELERRYGLTGDAARLSGDGSPDGPTVTVTLGQYRAMERGGVATTFRGLVPHRYRIDADDLIRWTAVDGESRHRIVRTSMRGRIMVIRYAGEGRGEVREEI